MIDASIQRLCMQASTHTHRVTHNSTVSIKLHFGLQALQSSMAQAVKIVVCGPSRSGKTSLANYIAGLNESIGHPNGKYEPTIGVRCAYNDAYTYVKLCCCDPNHQTSRPLLLDFFERSKTHKSAQLSSKPSLRLAADCRILFSLQCI
jgi:ATPase subunit of ABC transporter with duplicated ATPase domains